MKRKARKAVSNSKYAMGNSPKAFSQLVIPATELKNKLEGMEKKLDAVCDGECS